MRIFSYVIARDYGFAPNPFFGFCSLATCKPKIRKAAQPGDLIIGTGSACHSATGKLIFFMYVSETVTFSDYWNDPRFSLKKPLLSGSRKQAYGDNIYHKAPGARTWHQANSHHSCPDGSPNHANIEHDTQTDRVLIGTRFAYFGRSARSIPGRFLNPRGVNICAIRHHKCKFDSHVVTDVVDWINSLGVNGFLGEPFDWP